MCKTIAEINAKIKEGKAVVMTAEEIIPYTKEHGLKNTAKTVDVVTTGTFGPMCSSGAYINTGQPKPKIKFGGGTITLNGVQAYAGFAAVDLMIGAGALPLDDPRNRRHPGDFDYGGGHVIEDLVSGKDIALVSHAYGTDCYPRKELQALINIKDLNQAVLCNFRNGYQNYNVAVNKSGETIYTYMGILKAYLANANYCSAGALSPLLNDPYYKTIGIGTRIFLGGGQGYIVSAGTQHNPEAPRTENGVPTSGAGTLAVTGDLKNMKSRYLVGTSIIGYGTTLSVGIGIPIPILDEEILQYTLVEDKDIYAPVIDYSEDYPLNTGKVLGNVSYADLRSGKINLNGRFIPTAALSSLSRAREIADELRRSIQNASFTLTEMLEPLPQAGSGYSVHGLKERPLEEDF
ncbi:MAG: homocysteine biosynthesis protein [Chloroflexi bacterium]|nr:homocysteine biosynthesis protein [Chloroflexota bacterium]